MILNQVGADEFNVDMQER
ncbi:hypothetical protein C5167_027253 [Papaver somniferum]|nr:hypothetical protein C5167_027253 [Papaver somniferum]